MTVRISTDDDFIDGLCRGVGTPVYASRLMRRLGSAAWTMVINCKIGQVTHGMKQPRKKIRTCVWYRRSVSKPKLSTTGRKALTRKMGVPGLGTSAVTWPRRLASTV